MHSSLCEAGRQAGSTVLLLHHLTVHSSLCEAGRQAGRHAAPLAESRGPSTQPCPPLPGAAPGYNPAVVTSFYLPYLVVPALLALHMAAVPQPFGKAGGGAPKGKGGKRH